MLLKRRDFLITSLIAGAGLLKDTLNTPPKKPAIETPPVIARPTVKIIDPTPYIPPTPTGIAPNTGEMVMIKSSQGLADGHSYFRDRGRVETYFVGEMEGRAVAGPATYIRPHPIYHGRRFFEDEVFYKPPNLIWLYETFTTESLKGENIYTRYAVVLLNKTDGLQLYSYRARQVGFVALGRSGEGQFVEILPINPSPPLIISWR